MPRIFATLTSNTTQYLNITSIQFIPEPPIVLSARKYSPSDPSFPILIQTTPIKIPSITEIIRQSIRVSFGMGKVYQSDY